MPVVIDDDDTVCIYALCDPEPPHQVHYVGQTSMGLRARYYMHMSGRKSGHKAEWLNALRVKGRKPVIRALERVSPEQADERERFHIADQLAKGAPLVNVLHIPGRIVRRKSVRHTAAARIRFRSEQYEVLKEIAEDEGIPIAILIRNWTLSEMRRRKPERFGRDEEGER